MKPYPSGRISRIPWAKSSPSFSACFFMMARTRSFFLSLVAPFKPSSLASSCSSTAVFDCSSEMFTPNSSLHPAPKGCAREKAHSDDRPSWRHGEDVREGDRSPSICSAGCPSRMNRSTFSARIGPGGFQGTKFSDRRMPCILPCPTARAGVLPSPHGFAEHRLEAGDQRLFANQPQLGPDAGTGEAHQLGSGQLPVFKGEAVPLTTRAAGGLQGPSPPAARKASHGRAARAGKALRAGWGDVEEGEPAPGRATTVGTPEENHPLRVDHHVPVTPTRTGSVVSHGRRQFLLYRRQDSCPLDAAGGVQRSGCRRRPGVVHPGALRGSALVQMPLKIAWREAFQELPKRLHLVVVD